MSINKCIFIGHLGADAEVKFLDGGIAVANFSIACTEKWTDKQNQKQEKTEWINCVAWKGLAEVAEKYFKKGMHLYVEGKYTTEEYTKDNEKRYATKIKCTNIQMLGKKE